MSLTFAGLCRELFLLSHLPLPDAGPARGHSFERRVADRLGDLGAPLEAVPGGFRVYGHSPLSGLAHQIDASIGCSDCLVIGEWKSHRGPIPKNELLRFKAATDDFYMALRADSPRRPIMRLFGGAGRASTGPRRYAALHGIAIIDPDRWPAPLLADASRPWPAAEPPPPPADRRSLAWLTRPLQRILTRRSDGSYTIPPPPPSGRLDSLDALHQHWSERMWEAVEDQPGVFESALARRWPAA